MPKKEWGVISVDPGVKLRLKKIWDDYSDAESWSLFFIDVCDTLEKCMGEEREPSETETVEQSDEELLREPKDLM